MEGDPDARIQDRRPHAAALQREGGLAGAAAVGAAPPVGGLGALPHEAARLQVPEELAAELLPDEGVQDGVEPPSLFARKPFQPHNVITSSLLSLQQKSKKNYRGLRVL